MAQMPSKKTDTQKVGGRGSQGGGGYARPTITTCIPPGGMCVWGGFGEAASGCCEAGAPDGQVCPQWLW